MFMKKMILFKRFLCVGLSIILYSSHAGTVTYAGNYEVDENTVIEDGFLSPENTTIVHELDTGAAPYTLIANPVDELWVGEHHRFTVAANRREKVSIRWYSSNPKVAKINKKTGELTALSGGNVTITMHDTVNKVKKRLKLMIKAEPVLPELPEEWYTVGMAEDIVNGEKLYGVSIILKEEYRYLYEKCSMLQIPEQIDGMDVLYVCMEDNSVPGDEGDFLCFKNLELLIASSAVVFRNIYGDVRECVTYELLYSDDIQSKYDCDYYYDNHVAPEKLTIPEGTTHVVSNEFANDKAKLVRVPASVTRIWTDDGDGHYFGMISGEQTNFSVDGNNTNYFSIFGVLFATKKDGKECVSLMNYPDSRSGSVYRVPDGVEEIHAYAFQGAKNLKKIILPESVTTIGGGAFYGLERKVEIVVPASVTVFEEEYDGGPFGWSWDENAQCYDVTIITPKGSAAEKYAIEHNIPYRNERNEHDKLLKTVNYLLDRGDSNGQKTKWQEVSVY